MKQAAIIFDLDGTLLDTLNDLALSVNAVLGKRGLAEHPVEAYRYFVGDGVDELVKRAFPPPCGESESLEKLVSEVKGEYSRRWADHTVPYPGIPELLDFLEERQIPMAVFSNKPHEFALLTVETLLPKRGFTSVYGVGPGMPRKPDPHGALLIAGEMGCRPAEIAYLGDTNTDMQTAVAGGFFPVGALWGFRPAAELRAAGARLLVGKPLDVIRVFG